MKNEFEERWRQEITERKGQLKTPADLLRRKVSAEDYIDSAIIAGVELTDILAGKVAESQIPNQVIEAFHEQYPQYGNSFVEAVQHFYNEPDRLMGLVSGIKGKLFEIYYVDWLNHGHLPAGYIADLAEHANNPAWDVAIHDAHGQVAELLQAKASEYLGHAYEALAAHPNIDVVIPEDVYEHLSGHESIFEHLVNGHVNLADVNGTMNDAVDAAHNAGVAEHFPIAGPIIVIGVTAWMNFQKYKHNQMPLKEYLQHITERGALSVIASGAGWAVTALAHEPFIGLPVSVGIRLLGGQALHNYHQREKLDCMVAAADESRNALTSGVQKYLPAFTV